MPRSVVPVLLLFGLLTLCAVPASPQLKTGSIIGQVRVLGKPFPDRRILISIDARSVPYTSTYTDDEGRFTFADLPANPYQLSVNDPEFDPVRITVVLNPDLTPTTMAMITLYPRKVERPKEGGPRVSGSNPHLVDREQVAREYPGEALRKYDEGLKASQRGDIPGAIARFKEALAIAPDYYPARNNLGLMYVVQREFDLAENEFQAVIAGQKADANAYFNLANVCLVTGRLEASLQHVEAGLQREPGNAFGLFLLGSVHSKAGRLEEAEEALLRAMQADEKMSNVHLELVNVYLQGRHPEKAIAQLMVFLKRFPKDPMAPQARTVLARLQSRTTDH